VTEEDGSPEKQPLFRAGFMKSMIAACDDYHPEEKKRILARLPVESLE
jgi:hypothetical protein